MILEQYALQTSCCGGVDRPVPVPKEKILSRVTLRIDSNHSYLLESTVVLTMWAWVQCVDVSAISRKALQRRVNPVQSFPL